MTTFNGTLAVTIADAQHSTPQRGSYQDPYCIVTLGSSGTKRFLEGSTLGKEKFKTKVHNNAGQHPIWNETHNFDLKNMKADSHLKVKLYDKDVLKDDYIGLARVDLQELLKHDKQGVKYYPLYKKGMLGQQQGAIGQVGVGVQFNCTEIPQGQADLKSQVRDTLVRKDQQVAGVAGHHQQAHPSHIQGPGQMQQPTPATGYHQQTAGPVGTGTGTGIGTGTGYQQTTGPVGTGIGTGIGTGTGYQQQTGHHSILPHHQQQQQGYNTTIPQTQQQQGFIPQQQMQGQMQGQMGTQVPPTKGTYGGVPQVTQGTHTQQRHYP